MRKMRFCRVMFGINSSPKVVIRHHLDQSGEERVIQELRSILYVNDWLMGGDNKPEVLAMYEAM